MESKPNNAPLIAIVGETGSGKSSMAIELAKYCDGEIICADSRTIYKGMDIGTAKPTLLQRAEVPHHLLDITNPAEAFSAAKFKEAAERAIDDISARRKIPLLVGGTGLYVDAVLFDYQFAQPPNLKLRTRLQALSVAQLQQEIIANDLPMPQNDKNPRHLMRVIETGGQSQQRLLLRKNTLVIGITVDRTELKQRIENRVSQMFEDGLIDEVRQLQEVYGWEAPGMQSPGYAEFKQYFTGQQTLLQTQDLIVQHHLNLAKRQRTWFKRNKSIHWISKQEQAVDLVTTLLNK